MFVNGVWVGIHRDPTSILARREDFDTDISLVYDIQEKELRMWARGVELSVERPTLVAAAARCMW